jgi:hypothetical protein
MDALRAAAMLLGIAYHAALSFSLDAGWIVRDLSQSKLLYFFQAFVHGFRMQLFMILSGFFTAMLWRKEGLMGLLSNRFRRVLLPCVAGLLTVVPAMKYAVSFAATAAANQRNTRESVAPDAGMWNAIKRGDFSAFAEHSKMPDGLTRLHPDFKIPALSWAALNGNTEIVGVLLEKGADVHWRSSKGHTALHGAAFLGRHEVAKLLIGAGADINALSLTGERPKQSASTPYSAVEPIARLLGIEVQKEQVLEGRQHILRMLNQSASEEGGAARATPAKPLKETFLKWVNIPVFSLLWFLWFLLWLNLLFSIYATAAKRFDWSFSPHPLLVSQRSLAWLVPLTVIPTWLMRSGHGEFGPDTSMGILPAPHVLGYYALFFGFGVLYFESNDEDGRLGRSWRWTFPVALLLVLPVALEFATGTFGMRDKLLPAAHHRAVTVVFQALYAWMMSFAWIGVFRSLLTRENNSIRYLSDASYWCYLAHLPLVIATQALISQWPLPAMLKFLTTCLFVGMAVLFSYDKIVRYSLIGTFLNGCRNRRVPQRQANTAPNL